MERAPTFSRSLAYEVEGSEAQDEQEEQESVEEDEEMENTTQPNRHNARMIQAASDLTCKAK